MCRFVRWDIKAVSDAARARRLPLGIVGIGPPFGHEALPPEVGALLPAADTNLELLSVLEAAPRRFDGLAVGLVLFDPFLNVDLAIRRLRRAATAWVATLPSACQHEPELRQYLREVDLDLERELRVLGALSDAALATIATVSSAADAAVAGGVATALFVLPDVGAFVDGYPSLAVRQRLERAARAATKPPPLCLGLRRPGEAAGDIDGVVLRPQPFAAYP